FCLRGTPGTDLPYGKLLQLLNDPHVTFHDVQVTPTEIQGRLTEPDGRTTRFVTGRRGLENDPSLVPLLRQKLGPDFAGETEESIWKTLAVALLPPLLTLLALGVGFVWVLHKLGGRGLLAFGQSKAHACTPEELAVTFRNVAGIDEAVEELGEVVDFLCTPEKYRQLGGRIPRGVLLVGPPGTGKTLLARAVAGEAHVPFFSLSGSDFVEMYVGVGAARVRDLFARAAARAPCIVFIDELDALGKARGGKSASNDERDQTLNQLLVEMDGFRGERDVILMAATNRPEMLDPALLRPGRFDRTVVVDRPDVRGREAILRVHAAGVRLAAEVSLRDIAALTPGFAGADLANLINEAALLAARRGRAEVEPTDLEEALERGVAGLERKNRLLRPAERQRVAYHETGHALVACLVPGADPVHKVSIIPRGLAALGYTMQRPEGDRFLTTRSELLGQIKVLLAGTLAEELIYDEPSTGAQNDLERASRIAAAMVKQFGMSALGRVAYHDSGPSPFLAGDHPAGDRPYSEQTARRIDREVQRIIDEAAAEVRALLHEWRDAFEAVTRRLLEQEVIDRDELRELLRRYPPGPRDVS
ncbi:MAG TPA: ATP-dependent zinc metalloprotease FtsH, partial [Gemmataceae bacterium]|nr:ATP-dependent zinc metalloprotease FtsH [Gemmataceae bacterium]